MKPVYTLRVPEHERTLHLGTPTWTHVKPTPKHAPSTPPQHVTGTWARKLWALKHQLDHPPYCTHWNTYKVFTNEYERIHVSSNRARKSENIAAYTPLSRSYFKMWELLHDFGDLLPRGGDTSVTTAHLAEGPGGFIEAVARYRRLPVHVTASTPMHPPATPSVSKDTYTGITLKPTQRDVPGWGKSQRLLRIYPQIRLHTGADGTGNLYNVANVHKLVADTGRHACDLVTGDGGIDYSTDFAHQEPLSFRLLLAQVYAGLLLLGEGKTFVCKFFDMHERFTHDLLWVLAVVFDAVHLVKPLTSRVANSERYVVARGYRIAPKALLDHLRKLLYQWRADKRLTSVLHRPPPDTFRTALHTYNEWYAEQQHTSIATCLRMIDAAVTWDDDDIPPPDKDGAQLTDEQAAIVHRQRKSAIDWCRKYGVVVNG